MIQTSPVSKAKTTLKAHPPNVTVSNCNNSPLQQHNHEELLLYLLFLLEIPSLILLGTPEPVVPAKQSRGKNKTCSPFPYSFLKPGVLFSLLQLTVTTNNFTWLTIFQEARYTITFPMKKGILPILKYFFSNQVP